jgi:integrase
MPIITFTARKIDSLKPKDRPVDYRSDDPRERGFMIRVRASGQKTWLQWLRRQDGTPTTITLGDFSPTFGLAKAREKASKERAKVRLGRNPADEARAERAERKRTFGALFESYCERRDAICKANPDALRSWPRVKRILTQTVIRDAKWGKVPVRDIGRRDVAELLTRRLLEGGPYMANRLQAYLSHLFYFAVEREWMSANPVSGLKRGTERKEHKRDRVLSAAEIQALWAYLDGDGTLTLSRGTGKSGVVTMPSETAHTLKDLFRVLLLTAQRIGETSKMKWADVDLAAATWQIPPTDTKNKQPHQVPLSKPVTTVLEARQKAAAADAVFVFPSSPSGQADCYTWSARTASAISKAIGLEFRAHDLRRTASTQMGDLNIGAETIDRVLNHARKGVLAHYDLSKREAAKAAALTAWATRLQAIVTGTKARVLSLLRKGGR